MLRRNYRRPERARGRRVAADSVGQSGGRFQDPCRRAACADCQFQPRTLLGDVGEIQRAGSRRAHDVRPDDRRVLDLHRIAGDRAGYLRDLCRGRPPALRRRSLGQVDPDRGSRRHGRRTAARRRAGGRFGAGDRMSGVAHRFPLAHPLPRAQGAWLGPGAGHDSRCGRAQDGDFGRAPRQRGRVAAGNTGPLAIGRDASGYRDRPDLGPRSRARLFARRMDGRALARRAAIQCQGARDRCQSVDRETRRRDAGISPPGHPYRRLRQQYPSGSVGRGRRRRIRLSRIRSCLHPPAFLPGQGPVQMGRSVGRSRRHLPDRSQDEGALPRRRTASPLARHGAREDCVPGAPRTNMLDRTRRT